MYVGIWALKEPSCGAWIYVLRLWFGCRFTMRLTPICFSAWLAQSVVTRHQHWSNKVASSLLRHESRAAVLPPSSGAARLCNSTFINLSLMWVR